MTLQALRDMRLQGQRPSTVITVLIGKRPKWKNDGATLVVIPADATPSLLDFRPLVGLWVALVMANDDYALAGKVLDALKAAGAKLFGAAYPCGIYPCVENAGYDHRRVLHETRELLCR